MIIKNFFEAEYQIKSSHGGKGLVKDARVFDEGDFDTALRFVIYNALQPGSSIGVHPHGQDEEVYVVRHHYISCQKEPVARTHFTQSANKQVSCLGSPQQWQSVVATEGQEMQITATVVPFQLGRHEFRRSPPLTPKGGPPE